MTEVFRPSDGGNLATRSNLNEGYEQPVDSFRRSTYTPQLMQGGNRFGHLSQNSFFTRHNPHPNRVKHFKGLLDVPICSVNDDGYFANPRYSLQFPPNHADQSRLQRIPVNAINVNSQFHPINTITGLQYFTGLTNYPFRERAIPRFGLVPVTEAWRDELKALTDAVREGQTEPPKESKQPERPRTQYSESTGRLIPPPSRAMSRGPSRQCSHQSQRHLNQRNFQHIAENPDIESQVLMMLCQILQTEDVNAVQAWLCSASEREKAMVLDMIRAAIATREDYFQRAYKPEFVLDDNVPKLPPINEKDDGKPKTINRLTMDDNGTENIESWKQPVASTWNPEQSIMQQPKTQVTENMRPPTSDAFRKLSVRPATQQNGRMPTPKASPQEKPLASQSVFPMTNSAKDNPTQTTVSADPSTNVETRQSPNTF